MNTPTASQGRAARYATIIVRVLLGLAFVVFGLNAFLNFIPPPPPEDFAPEAMAFSAALMESGYMMPLIGVTQLFVGVCLLINCFVPLALVVLAPFMVNSVAFHIVLEPAGLPMSIVFTVLMLYLAWVHRAAYRPLLTPKGY